MKVLSAVSTALICFTSVVFAEGPQYLGIDLSEKESGMYSLEAFDDVPPGGWSSRHKTDMIVLRRITDLTILNEKV